jgi:GMP synthase (glutamine-hydrolysing)
MKHRYRGVILSGGPLRYDSEINIENVDIDLAVLLDLGVPTLGICFGHQTIVEAFDGRIKKLKKMLHKQERIEITKRCDLFKGLPKRMYMEEYHRDYASQLPYNFERIAKSPSCSIEGIKHKNKHIYGVQFHPEASGELGTKLLDNFLHICKLKFKLPKRRKG